MGLRPVRAIAVLDRSLRLHGGLDQWRTITGLLRAELASLPLPCWLHPDDVERLLAMVEIARVRTVVGGLRLGRLGHRVPVRLELGQWLAPGRAVVEVEGEPLTLQGSSARFPPLPRTCEA